MIGISQARRLEWKYCVPPERAHELWAALQLHTNPDIYCSGPEDAYRVRSLYYDTPSLRFYHEKKDRLKVRRKLRVRDYGGDQYFLEIKRKIDREVVKERVIVPAVQLASALDGADPAVLMAGRSDEDRRTLERFRHNVTSLGLVPTLLVSYRRRAMTGRAEPDLRITLDDDLRGRRHSEPNRPFLEEELHPFESRNVLELKFTGRPVRWLVNIVRQFGLKREPYSKYCEGIDRCSDPASSNGAGSNNQASSS
jgi:hypothetical protein